jgi:hypothetical protein
VVLQIRAVLCALDNLEVVFFSALRLKRCLDLLGFQCIPVKLFEPRMDFHPIQMQPFVGRNLQELVNEVNSVWRPAFRIVVGPYFSQNSRLLMDGQFLSCQALEGYNSD